MKTPFVAALNKYLATGELVPVEDAAPLTDLQKHDRRFHPNGYKQGDSCKYRESLARGDSADNLAKAEKEEAAGGSASLQDLQALHDIRDRLERIARLLNGRAGNLAALQASSRWNDLDNYPASGDYATLGSLSQSTDPALAKAAADLAVIANNISASKQSGWTLPAGMVPSVSSLPQLPVSAAPSGGSPTQLCGKKPGVLRR